MNPFKQSLLFLFLGLNLLSFQLLSAAPEKKIPSQKDRLIFAVDVIRHGDRNPIIEIPTAPHDWPEGLGQLTPLGMHQEYELGKEHRHYYIDQEKLLPKSYQTGTIYVRSTDVDRTLMSAECFLMGLYPPGSGPMVTLSLFGARGALPGRFQPIPINTTPQGHDELLAPHHEELIKKNVFSTPEWKKKREELQPHFASWSKATGIAVEEPKKLERLGDALFIRRLKHISLPKNLTEKEAATIVNEEEKAFTAMFKNPEVGKALGGPLLRDIAHYLREAVLANKASLQKPQKQVLKYVLYSAHDNTILALMTAMGVPLDTKPHYASDVNISLFSQPDHSYYVRIIYNGKPVVLSCSNRDACSPLESFLKLALAK